MIKKIKTVLNKLFFETKMSYPRVIIFAVIVGVLTGLIATIPEIKGTSFADISVGFEWWVFFAVIIAMNSKKPVEAGIKTFIFFLISQPLVFLVQVPFSAFGWQLFPLYYGRWFIWTLLTLPGGMIAWFVKKKNVLSSIILGVATAFLGANAVYYGCGYFTPNVFPRHLLTIIFIVLQIVIYIFTLLDTKKLRLITTAITVAVTGAYLIYAISMYGSGPVIFEDPYPADCVVEEGTCDEQVLEDNCDVEVENCLENVKIFEFEGETEVEIRESK